MKEASGKTTPRQRAILGVLMLGLLLATVGAAWLLESSSSRRVRAAAEILAEIRKEGLDSFWPAELEVHWYLAQKDKRIIGWRAAAAGRSQNGDFLGVDVDMQGRRQDPVCEQWRLNADATEGAYTALVRTPLGYRPDTDITLQRGSVKVVQHNLPNYQRLQARSPAPENYLPEGLLEPVVRRVAAAGADAQFRLVFNDQPNPGGVVQYGSYRIRHLGRKTQSEGSWVDRVGVSAGGPRSGHALTYELDEKGRLLLVSTHQGLRWTPASEVEVTRVFPRASDYLLELMPRGLPRPDADLLPDRLELPDP
ncbi:MAG: hypothetical protein AMJ81_01715 [Phycisphaerae bacterium SM23_33]|nr:MAG: hypothetical protein AMJ81_01715 [Phycisphaerae bacterium SM23_33]